MTATTGASVRAVNHRLGPLAWGTTAVMATYASFQLLAGHSAVMSAWWKHEWLRRALHARWPSTPLGPAPPEPTAADWVGPSVTAVVLVAALVVVALALVAAGRGWWLLLVSALPLLPTQVAPGVWAPALSNQVLYAVVWPAGASQPSIAWSWLSAGVDALVVAVPAAAFASVVVARRPAVFSAEVVRRLAPLAMAAAMVVTWNWRAGLPQNWTHLAGLAAWMLLGALLLTGGLRPWWAALVLVAAAALAQGLVSWTPALDGQPVVVDPAAWSASVAAMVAGGWVLVAPRVGHGLRWCLGRWQAMVAADVQARDRQQRATPRRAGLSSRVSRQPPRDCGAADPRDPAADPDLDTRLRATSWGSGGADLDLGQHSALATSGGRVSHRAPAGAAGGGGRHRG